MSIQHHCFSFGTAGSNSIIRAVPKVNLAPIAFVNLIRKAIAYLHNKYKQKSSLKWDITLCSPLKANGYFGEMQSLHLQNRRMSRVKTSVKSRDKQSILHYITENRNLYNHLCENLKYSNTNLLIVVRKNSRLFATRITERHVNALRRQKAEFPLTLKQMTRTVNTVVYKAKECSFLRGTSVRYRPIGTRYVTLRRLLDSSPAYILEAWVQISVR
jgi:hypothetical protein